MKRFLAILSLILISTQLTHAVTWTTLDYPGAYRTTVFGIDADNVVGTYLENEEGITRSFKYNLNSKIWTNIDAPGASRTDSESGTQVRGISGNKIAGFFQDNSGKKHGFIYDNSTWTTLDHPESSPTYINDIQGNTVVGYCFNGSFLYNGSTWINFNKDNYSTFAHRIDGQKIVGNYGGQNMHGFIFDGTNWTTLDVFGALKTYIWGIDGSNVVGYFILNDTHSYHGFLNDGTDSYVFDMPGASSTYIYDIDGNKLVGSYSDGISTHGFVCEIPEPASILIFTLGGLFLRRQKNAEVL